MPSLAVEGRFEQETLINAREQMAKSLRSKRKKRLRTLKREISEPFYEKKEAAKLAALEGAIAAPKVPVKSPIPDDEPSAETSAAMDVEMADGGSSSHNQSKSLLKPIGGISKKKLKKKQKLKGNKHGKGKGKISKRKI